MVTKSLEHCDVTGCMDVKRHRVQVGPKLRFGVCDRCQETVYDLGKRYDREFLELEERFFKLFKALKGETYENPD